METTLMPNIEKRTVTPGRRPNAAYRAREYLTDTEVARLQAAAKGNRWSHRDATMILKGYRHGLRGSELVDLRWDQVGFNAATMAIRRVKKGISGSLSSPGGGVAASIFSSLRWFTTFNFSSMLGGGMPGGDSSPHFSFILLALSSVMLLVMAPFSVACMSGEKLAASRYRRISTMGNCVTSVTLPGGVRRVGGDIDSWAKWRIVLRWDQIAWASYKCLKQPFDIQTLVRGKIMSPQKNY